MTNASKKIANKLPTKKRGNPNWKKGGPSPNPAGRPATGESWTELIKKIGDMTPKEAADYCRAIAGKLAPIGDAVTLKEAVVLRVYAALLFEPQPGLLNTFIERAEGKVAQPVEVYDWRADVVKYGGDPDALVADLFSKVNKSDE